VPGSLQDLHLGWTFDPACSLTAHCPAIGFDFRTRAATFADDLTAALVETGATLAFDATGGGGRPRGGPRLRA
jgi:hypothetical protein